MQKFRLLFMGTTFFSEHILETLLTTMAAEIEVVGLVCQPDRKIGRNKEVTPVPIKKLASKYGLPVFQPEKIIDCLHALKKLQIDVIVTCAYGQFLPKAILELPKYNCLNIHASLLPQLRGGAPIQWAIINNLQMTGITLMKMVSKMDAGDIYVQDEIAISSDETYLTLAHKLIGLAQKLVVKNLVKIINNEIAAQKQDESKVTFGLNIQRSDEKINWNNTARVISCHVRGLYNMPIAYTILHDVIYKIHEVTISNQSTKATPGTIVAINKLGIVVATKSEDIIIKIWQPASKKPTICSYYYGTKVNPIKVGYVFS